MVPGDLIHTVYKGPLEDAIVYTHECMYFLDPINKDLYGSIPAVVDNMMKNCPRKFSVCDHYSENMANGITCFFSKDRSKNSGPGQKSGKLFGAFAASRLPGIASMLTACIGNNGYVLPNTVVPIERKNKLLQQALQEVLEGLNVEEIVQKALKSNLDVIAYSSPRREGFTNANFVELGKKIQLLRAHMADLFDLRNTLKQCAKHSTAPFINALTVTSISKYKFQGIKLHHCSHLPRHIYNYGDINFFNTDRSEHAHIQFKGINPLL